MRATVTMLVTLLIGCGGQTTSTHPAEPTAAVEEEAGQAQDGAEQEDCAGCIAACNAKYEECVENVWSEDKGPADDCDLIDSPEGQGYCYAAKMDSENACNSEQQKCVDACHDSYEDDESCEPQPVLVS